MLCVCVLGCMNICTVCICLWVVVCQCVSWWISWQGRGNPYYTWIESLKPKQTVANSPAAWPLLQIVNVQRQDYRLPRPQSTHFFPCFLYTRHQSQFHKSAAQCSSKATTVRNKQKSRFEAQTGTLKPFMGKKKSSLATKNLLWVYWPFSRRCAVPFLVVLCEESGQEQE